MASSCRKPWDWGKAAVIVLFLNMRGRLKFEWARSEPWHRWGTNYPSMIKFRLRMMRFNRFSEGEATDDFW